MLCVLIRIASKAILMSTLNIQLLCRSSVDFPELAIFASRPGAMINLHWLELPMARTIFHGPKGVQAIEVWLYFQYISNFRSQITYSFVKYGCLIFFFLNSANRICQSKDISKYFRESLRVNESQLYFFIIK